MGLTEKLKPFLEAITTIMGNGHDLSLEDLHRLDDLYTRINNIHEAYIAERKAEGPLKFQHLQLITAHGYFMEAWELMRSALWNQAPPKPSRQNH